LPLKGDPVPDEHHVLRHCSGLQIERSPETGEMIGVTKEAFDDDDPDGISVTWVEYFAQSADADRAAIGAIRATPRTVRASHRFAKFNVGRIRTAGQEAGVALGVEQDPVPNNPGHALLKGLVPTNHTELMARLALDLMALLSP
jgi:hypothetical protein